MVLAHASFSLKKEGVLQLLKGLIFKFKSKMEVTE